MKKNVPRFLIAAPKSGSGKTIMTCGFLQVLKEEGIAITSFKCGPDYIDPMFHKQVIQIPARNLDTFFSDGEEVKRILAENSDAALMEGVMGLYDGLGGIREEGSAYHLAKTTRTPIVLVMDAHGMGRTLVPLLGGLLSEDTEHLIKGVILNRTSRSFAMTMKPLIEKQLGIQMLGVIPTLRELNLESRHLGLKLPQEVDDLKGQVSGVAKVIRENVDLPAILRLMEAAEPITYQPSGRDETTGEGLTLGVARDEAFCFYYEENLDVFRRHGVTIREFSPMHDPGLPKGLDGILLGGGYPELAAKKLSENQSMRQQIHDAIASGMPSLAECGGFMYLHDQLEGPDGKLYPMAEIIPGKCYNTGKLCRFGYVEIEAGDFTIKGHEFHYYDSENNGNDCTAVKPVTKKSWACMHQREDHLWGYPHLYYASCPEFTGHFLDSMRAYRKGRTD